SVERDLLAAGGGLDAKEAAAAALAACTSLGDAARATEAMRAAVDRAGLGAADPGLPQIDRLPDDAAGLASAPVREGEAADAFARAGEDVARELAGCVARISGRDFVQVQVDARLELALQGPHDAAPVTWDELAADVRDRLALALALRRAASRGGEH